jgi:hypothetical protein
VNIIVVLFSARVVHYEIIKWSVAVILSECVAVILSECVTVILSECVAVILSECVAVDDILLPCAEQEPVELYQQVTDSNEEKEE